MNTNIFKGVLFTLFFFSFQFFASSPSFADTAVKLALDWKPEPEFGGFYEAQRADLYKKQGLSVEILPGGAGQPVVQMIAAGKVEFGIASSEEVILARSHGADVVALFSVYQTYPMGIMVHKSLGVKRLADLFEQPLTLALEKGLAYTKFLEKKYGFSKVKVVPYSGGIGEFLHNKKMAQQCFVTSEPLAAKKSGSDPQPFLIADAGFNPYTTVVVVKGSYLKENGDTVKKMIQAVRSGWKQYLANSKPANELMHKLNGGMDLATFEEAAKTQKPLIETKETKAHGLGSMTKERWEALANQLLEIKNITKPVDVSECFSQKLVYLSVDKAP